MGDPSRRAFLGGVGVASCAALGGSLALGTDDGPRGVADRAPVPSASGDPREDFVWLAPGVWRDERLRENLVAFAARHDLAAVFSQPDVEDARGVDRVLAAMAETRAAGVTPWLETAVPYAFTPKQFAERPVVRARHLDALRSAARRYAEVAPEGNLVLWEEAPVAGEWVPGGAWTDRSARMLERYGPALYAHQRTAVAEAAPDVSVGVFVHFPYVVENRQPEVFAGLMADLADRGALPDFVFTDFYRGWYEKDVGPGPATAAVRSLVSNAARHSGGRPVYFMGQAHTINPRHTPSTQAMRMDLRAATAAGARGVGWYVRTAYKRTRRGFDPFVPNRPAESSMPDDVRVNTLTVARDRFAYAYRATLADRERPAPSPRVDCWLHLDSPGFYGHRVAARTGDGWTTLGDVAGAHPRVAPVEDGEHVSVFHALDAARFLADGELALRFDTREGHGGRLLGVYVLPFDPGVAVTERAATDLVGEGGVSLSALGASVADVPLAPGESLDHTVAVPGVDSLAAGRSSLRAPAPRVADLLAPGTVDDRVALLAAESVPGFDREARFDLWTRTDATDPRALLAGFDLEAAPVTATASDGAATFRGLSRRVLGEDPARTLADRVVGSVAGSTVRAAYAMPYFGSEDVRPPARVGTLLRTTPEEVERFAFASARR
jgi:hypothetical protein